MAISALGNSDAMRSTTWLPMYPAPPVNTILRIPQPLSYFNAALTYRLPGLGQKDQSMKTAGVQQEAVAFLGGTDDQFPASKAHDQPHRKATYLGRRTITQIESPRRHLP